MSKAATASFRKAEAERRERLRIGEVSRESGINIEALRFYERSGLLDRPARTAGGYRVYDADVIERLSFIKRAQSLGFSLDEIRRVIADSRAGQSPCAEVREIVRRRLAEIDERMKEMRRYRRELAGELRRWDETGEAKGHVCGLIEGANVRPGLKPGIEAARKKATRGRK